MLLYVQVCGYEKTLLPCWPSRGQQVSHQRWIWRIHCMQVTKHVSWGIHHGFEMPGKCPQKSKKGHQWTHKKDRCLRKYIFKKIIPSWCKVSSKIQASFTTAVYVSCVLMVRMMMYVLSWKAFCQIGSKQRIKFVTIISKQEPAMSSEVHCYHRCVPKVKIVKNPLLFLHQCTFTMHRPRVYSVNQWWSQQQR